MLDWGSVFLGFYLCYWTVAAGVAFYYRLQDDSTPGMSSYMPPLLSVLFCGIIIPLFLPLMLFFGTLGWLWDGQSELLDIFRN